MIHIQLTIRGRGVVQDAKEKVEKVEKVEKAESNKNK